MKTITKSKYDLDISFIYKGILTRINESSLNSKRRKVLLDEIKDKFNKFCIEHSVSKVKAKSIKKENNFYLYNENSCEGTFFIQWLSIFIIISPIYLITHILDYHYNSTKDKVSFLNKIEVLLLGFLYNYSEDFDLENHLLKEDENLVKAENINFARAYRLYAKQRMGWSRISLKKGKLLISHRYNLIPLLPSGPGGVHRELVV